MAQILDYESGKVSKKLSKLRRRLLKGLAALVILGGAAHFCPKSIEVDYLGKQDINGDGKPDAFVAVRAPFSDKYILGYIDNSHVPANVLQAVCAESFSTHPIYFRPLSKELITKPYIPDSSIYTLAYVTKGKIHLRTFNHETFKEKVLDY